MRSLLVVVSLFFALLVNSNFAVSATSSCLDAVCNFYPKVDIFKHSTGDGLEIVTPEFPATAVFLPTDKDFGAFQPLFIPFQVINADKNSTEAISYELFLDGSQHYCLTEGETELVEMVGITLEIDNKAFLKDSAQKTTKDKPSGTTPRQEHTLSITFPVQPRSESMQTCSGKIDIFAQRKL